MALFVSIAAFVISAPAPVVRHGRPTSLQATDYIPPDPTGIYKNTLAASDPLTTTYPWLLKYFPVHSTSNNAPGNVVACGQQGRVEMNGTYGFKGQAGADDGTDTFGIHSVLAAGAKSSRLAASGPVSLEQIEKQWTEAIGDLGADDTAYSTLLDNHLAMWAASLDPFVAAFQADDVGFVRITFEDGSPPTLYYSMIVHCPNSQLVLELISDVRPNISTIPWPLQATEGAPPRHFFQGQPPPTVVDGNLWPLHVSRFASDLQAVERWYGTVFEAAPTVRYTSADGTHIQVYGGTGDPRTDLFSPQVGLQFVQRPPALSYTDKLDGKAFENYQLAVAQEYQTNATSCWPVLGDNHIAIILTNGPTVETLQKRVASLGGAWADGALTHPFRAGDPDLFGVFFPVPNATYVVDPTGWNVQVDTPWGDFDYLEAACISSQALYSYCYAFCLPADEFDPDGYCLPDPTSKDAHLDAEFKKTIMRAAGRPAPGKVLV